MPPLLLTRVDTDPILLRSPHLDSLSWFFPSRFSFSEGAKPIWRFPFSFWTSGSYWRLALCLKHINVAPPTLSPFSFSFHLSSLLELNGCGRKILPLLWTSSLSSLVSVSGVHPPVFSGAISFVSLAELSSFTSLDRPRVRGSDCGIKTFPAPSFP